MKLDTLVDMAKETAAFGVHPSGEFIYSFYTEQLQAFAALVASAERERIKQANAPEIERINVHIKELEDAVIAEREACAKVCEEYETSNDITATWLNIVADAIRARGQA